MVPCRCSEGFLFRRFIVPKVRWSEGSLVRRFVDPKVRWSEGSLIRILALIFQKTYRRPTPSATCTNSDKNGYSGSNCFCHCYNNHGTRNY